MNARAGTILAGLLLWTLSGCASMAFVQEYAPAAGKAANRSPAAEPAVPPSPAISPAASGVTSQPSQADRQALLDRAYHEIYEGRYEPAAVLLRQLSPSAESDAPHGAETLFWLGFCEQELRHASPARRAYERLLSRWPGSRYAARARQLLAELPDGQ